MTRRIPVLLAVLALAPACSGSEDTRPLTDGWSFRWGDAELAEVSALPFESIAPLARPSGTPSTDRIGWFRIEVDTAGLRDPALLFGGMTGAFEAFVEGQRVAGSGVVRPGGLERIETTSWHLVPIPATGPRAVVLLRVQSHGDDIGPVREARLAERWALVARIARKGVMPFLVGGMLVALGFGALAGALWFGLNRALLAVGVYALVSGLMIQLVSELAYLWLPERRIAYDLLQATIAWTAPTFLFAGRANVAVMRTPFFQKAVQGSSLLAALATLVQFADVPWGGPVQKAALVAALAAMTIALVRLVGAALKGDREAAILVSGFAVLLVTGVFDSLPSFGVTAAADTFLTPAGFLAVVVAFGALGLRRSRLLSDELRTRTDAVERQRAEALELLQTMRGIGVDLQPVVGSLRASARAQAEGVSRQAAALQETQVTAEEIRRTSATAAEQAQQLLDGATSVEESGKQGETAVIQSLNGLEMIGNEVHEMAGRIAGAGGRVNEIAGIVGAVKDLADQSNMLALNAAIEAVRAGEHGKGFALVAREVRRLADESVRATVRIKEVLDGLSTSVNEAVELSARGERRVTESLLQMRTSGETIRRMVGVASETARTVRRISSAVTQQNAGVSQIFGAIEDLNAQMQDTLERSKESDAIAIRVGEAVSKLADGLGVAESRAEPGRTAAPPQPPVAAP